VSASLSAHFAAQDVRPDVAAYLKRSKEEVYQRNAEAAAAAAAQGKAAQDTRSIAGYFSSSAFEVPRRMCAALTDTTLIRLRQPFAGVAANAAEDNLDELRAAFELEKQNDVDFNAMYQSLYLEVANTPIAQRTRSAAMQRVIDMFVKHTKVWPSVVTERGTHA
jgi:hypothetical protein